MWRSHLFQVLFKRSVSRNSMRRVDGARNSPPSLCLRQVISTVFCTWLGGNCAIPFLPCHVIVTGTIGTRITFLHGVKRDLSTQTCKHLERTLSTTRRPSKHRRVGTLLHPLMSEMRARAVDLTLCQISGVCRSVKLPLPNVLLDSSHTSKPDRSPKAPLLGNTSSQRLAGSHQL